MFLSADVIRELVEQQAMIRPTGVEVGSDDWLNFENDRLEFIEGSGFDITLHEVYSRFITGSVPFIGREERSLPDYMPVTDRFVTSDIYHLYPAYYLLQSVEITTLPADIGGIVLPRSSFFNAECLIGCTRIAPGFSGQLRVGLYVCGHMGLKLQRGARFATVMFYRFSSGNTDAYRGIWSGDKVTTTGVERGY